MAAVYCSDERMLMNVENVKMSKYAVRAISSIFVRVEMVLVVRLP